MPDKILVMAQKKIQDIYPLSPMQQGMLFHSLLEPNSGAYIIQTAYEIHGYLDVSAFADAWQQLVDKYTVLRTAFVWDNLEQPLQVVGHKAKISLREHDWQDLPVLEQQEKLAAFLQQDLTTGFNLHQAPLMRLNLIKMRSQGANCSQFYYQFIWTYHHLLLDGWSVPMLIKELLGYYQSLTQKLDLPPTTAIPYKNYIAWLQQQDREKARKFWREELKNFYAPTSIGRSNQINRKQNSTYRQKDLQLSVETTYKLEFLAKEHQLTLNTLIQAAWAILLHRYSDDNDLVFGATSSGRPPSLAHSQTMIGLMINTLPVRVEIDPQQFLIDWLKQLQTKQIARQEYEYTSLIDLHRVSDVPQDTPLFESIVVVENYPVESSLKQSLDVLDLRNIQFSEQTNYPLTLYAAVNQRISLKLLYNAQLYEEKAIALYLEHLKTLLEAIASNPKQKVGELNILSALEREQLLTKINSTFKEYPHCCFHQLFEARVAEVQRVQGVQGSKGAVIADDGTLTYAQLNERANQLARFLRQSQGINCRDEGQFTVGVYLERDCDLIISLLAILKTGAAYIPLDPGYPNERLSYIINHAQISYLITKQNIDPQTFNPNHELTIINLEAEREIIQQQSTENLDLKIAPQDLAYVIYTSGSTGKPKGVAVQHDSLVNFLYSMREQLAITPQDRLLAITTIAFDIAALEIYLPLITGATIVLGDREITLNADRLSQKIAEHDITIMQATPITWQLLVANNWQGNKQLKILSGGEALAPQLASQLITKGKQVWNLYGPTETTIWSSVYQLPQDKDLDRVFLTEAIANTQLYVLDSQLRLVPPGAIGELYIGGAGLARGYFNQSDLTAEKFIPNPFSLNISSLNIEHLALNNPSAPPSASLCVCEASPKDSAVSFRAASSASSAPPATCGLSLCPAPLLYKTGDRVKLNLDGNLEYIGRVDNQVKLRGFRIELGEIEAVLNQHLDINKAIITVAGEGLEKRLVAYLLLVDKSNLVADTSSQLRSFLQDKLPHYMIPSNYVILKELPLTPNGKIDRAALPKIDPVSPRFNTAYKQPQSEIERAIAEIWQNVLQVERVGLTDNFFDLGGQSLLMIRVHGQLKDKLGVDISLVDMFRYPTVASLAESCDRSSSNFQIDAAIDKNHLEAGKNRLKKRLNKRRV